MGREPQVRSALSGLADVTSVTFVEADLDADAGWREAAVGCDYVMHMASPLPVRNPREDDELVRPARMGALRVLAAAAEAGVRRVVMTSSTAAISYGHGRTQGPFDERDWTDATDRKDTSAYERSKTLAERAAWDWLAQHGHPIELTTLNPGAVLGPVLGWDFSASIEIVRTLLAGEAPGLPRFGWPIVDVRDLAAVHVRALTAPQGAGQRFLVAGPFEWLAEIAHILKTQVPDLSRRVPTVPLPDFAVRLAAVFDPAIRERLFELGRYRSVDTGKAETLLDWSPRPVAETIVDTAKSLVATGVVHP